MSWQRIELNMIPDTKVLPVVHASQFDSNRSISFQMFTGEDEWTIPEGLTIELHCRKVDDNIVTLAPLSVDGSVITFITNEQLTACSGQNKCELSFIDADDLVIGSLNFILDVEPDPLKGGLTSTSSIYNLTQQIEDITQEVIGDDYYNKTEVDTLLADKADVSDLPDMSLYYTKTATDTLLNAKADKSDTYTKAQVDTALSAKANTADLATVATSGDYDDLLNKPTIPAAQVQSDYAQADNTQVDYIKNKPDINAMIAAALLAVMPVETQTGNPCTFDTDIATELQDLTADIVSSGGGGTPSTPIPIVGHSALNLNVNGETFTVSFGQTVYGGEYDANTGKVRLTYGYTKLKDLNWIANGVYPNVFNGAGLSDRKRNVLFDNTAKCNNYEAHTSSDIADYNYGIAFGMGDDNTIIYVKDIRCSTVSDFTTTITTENAEIAYELATPIEIDVSELSVSTIVGMNNITSDCNGDVTASYKVSIQKYVDDQ